MCYWSLELIFKAKLKLESGNWKFQYGHQAAISKVHMKFKIEIPKQTRVTFRKSCHLQSPVTEKSNITARRPLWHLWKSIGFFPNTEVLCYWSLDLIFKAKLKLESGNWKIKYGCQAAIFKLKLLKINRVLPRATKNMHMKFEIEIPKQTWVTLRKPCRLQMDRGLQWNWLHHRKWSLLRRNPASDSSWFLLLVVVEIVVILLD